MKTCDHLGVFVCLKEQIKIPLSHKNGCRGVYISGDSEVGQGFRPVVSNQIESLFDHPGVGEL